MTRPALIKRRGEAAQLVVECSDPGLVVSLAEEFEHVLRHVDFDRALALSDQLSTLAQELGPEFDRAWRGFRLETPNQAGCRPLTFSSRELINEEPVQELASHAEERGVGPFEVYHTSLLPQGGPAPETREQYVRDLADAIHRADMELGVFRWPVPLPETMAAHREQLMEDYVLPSLQARARFPAVGWKWVQDSRERVKKALQEVNTRAEAVMAYELARLRPADVEPREHIRWAALAVRLGEDVEPWYAAVEESLDYFYQKAALVWLLWRDGRGPGSARPFLEERLQTYVEQAESVYTADGVEALRVLDEELHQPPWRGLSGLLAEEEEPETQPPDTNENTSLPTDD